MDELALFNTARNHFCKYLQAHRELQWRVEHALHPKNKARKAVESLCGLDWFRCRADECACKWAARGGCFPTLASPTHAFYRQLVETRVKDWRDCTKPSMLDYDILQELGHHAFAFMQTTRELPHFEKSWNAHAEQEGIFQSSPLNIVEAKFRKAFAACAALFAPLGPENVREITLCLWRILPSGVAQQVVAFLCTSGRLARS